MTVRVKLLPAALEGALGASARALPLETGGIALGWYEGRTVVVAILMEVPDRRSTRTTYARDPIAADALIADARGADATVGYVGEWHSHPAIARPSWTDRGSIKRLAQQSELPIALVVVGLDGRGAHRIFTVAASTLASRSRLASSSTSRRQPKPPRARSR